jgi:predicted DNA-binding transcriptional regulator YafY
MSRCEKIVLLFSCVVLLNLFSALKGQAACLDLLPGSGKTFPRDIALLKRAGARIRYSSRRRAFVLEAGERGKPDFPGGKADIRFLEKIIRLIVMMDAIPYEDCDIWYADTFFWVSRRTMQRDFAVLGALGYRMIYERSEENPNDVPPRRYYCEAPEDTYSLETFRT